MAVVDTVDLPAGTAVVDTAVVDTAEAIRLLQEALAARQPRPAMETAQHIRSSAARRAYRAGFLQPSRLKLVWTIGLRSRQLRALLPVPMRSAPLPLLIRDITEGAAAGRAMAAAEEAVRRGI